MSYLTDGFPKTLAILEVVYDLEHEKGALISGAFDSNQSRNTWH
jgi:hypothetical protein